MQLPFAVAAGSLGAACCAGMYYAAGVPSSQVFGPSLVRARNSRMVALTFDDGPSESTPAVLEALADGKARAARTILAGLGARGISAVTVSELFGLTA